MQGPARGSQALVMAILETLGLIVVTFAAGALLAVAVMLVWRHRSARARRASDAKPPDQTVVLAERVRSVGRLVGLEVMVKEIATATRGFQWMPPLLLSQAKVAMIFHFEKQYAIDLTRIEHTDIEQTGPRRFRITLPPLEGTLRLSDVTPYDIQHGRVLGLFDVIPMTAERQTQLMAAAQKDAATLYESKEPKYLAEAKRSVARHLASLLELFDVKVEVVWQDEADRARPTPIEPAAVASARPDRS
ncbi:MAG: hypothetical protein KatS3mg103_0037 [Phycisphaerales bacterium]|nr:MAG: hypothetical protein KatS3mg103_0037 [Phycisphaerales bacterium]